MNTDIHWFALFLHPLCRKLAISSALHSRTISKAYEIAVDLAQRWNWTEQAAMQLIRDIKIYYNGEPPFAGGSANAKDWWTNLTTSAADHPLKALALKIFKIVPHAADVERLFSNLAGIQSVKQSKLSIEHLETFGTLRNTYLRILHEHAIAQGKKGRRQHAHMHTCEGRGINTELAASLLEDFTWTPPSTDSELYGATEEVPGPEEITLEQIDAEFCRLEEQPVMVEELAGDSLQETVPLEQVYAIDQLDQIREGCIPPSLEEEEDAVVAGPEAAGNKWDPKALLRNMGVS
ncbi:hypothetical protein EWM64_g9275 [Hericium alpestre]|uniref:HAT C-terminal dimerisation domain-containing protein n=1 Tax=Hericium alpestre TaxID=135208 RepID=A0A4Y9ZKZ6_9AGAM|nr:hypothetical protein EWM64_g9275 [Hericium alpestre]